jgi:transketolase
MFRPIPGCVVLYPSDAFASEACVAELAVYKGMGYIRTTRPATPLIYSRGEKFPIGGSKILRRGSRDELTVVAAGITVHESLKAFDVLKKEGIRIRVIDAYSIEPLDRKTIQREVTSAGGKVIVVEDHFAGGGLGDAVAQALVGKATALRHLCIRELPRSGKPQELLDKYGIGVHSIVRNVKEMVRGG